MRRTAGLFSNISNTEELKSELLQWDDFSDTDLLNRYSVPFPANMVVTDNYVTCSKSFDNFSFKLLPNWNLYEPFIVYSEYQPGYCSAGCDGGSGPLTSINAFCSESGSLPYQNLTCYGNPYNFFGVGPTGIYPYSYSCVGGSWNSVAFFCERGYQCLWVNGVLKKELNLPYNFPVNGALQYVRGSWRVRKVRIQRCNSASRYGRNL